MNGNEDDRQALRWRLLVEMRDDVVARLRRRLTEGDDVEDDVQEAMLRLAARPGLEDDVERARALLFRAAHNLAIDRHRAAVRRRILGERLAGEAQAQVGRIDELVADRGQARVLAAEVERLGVLERAAFTRWADGFDVGEIARSLGIGYKSAENALDRARRKLRLLARRTLQGLAAVFGRPGDQSAAPMALLGGAMVILCACGFGIGLWMSGGGAPPATALSVRVPVVPDGPDTFATSPRTAPVVALALPRAPIEGSRPDGPPAPPSRPRLGLFPNKPLITGQPSNCGDYNALFTYACRYLQQPPGFPPQPPTAPVCGTSATRPECVALGLPVG